jgi:predicted  nucleic acid-binding Zn-ribbon protein
MLKSEALFDEMDVFYEDLPQSIRSKMDKLEELLESDEADVDAIEKLDNQVYSELQAFRDNSDSLPTVDNRSKDSKAELGDEEDDENISPYFWM